MSAAVAGRMTVPCFASRCRVSDTSGAGRYPVRDAFMLSGWLVATPPNDSRNGIASAYAATSTPGVT